MKHNWHDITSLAYCTLIEQGLKEFPIPLNKIGCRGVKISSYQNYAKKTGLMIKDITLGNELQDAFVLKGLRPDVVLILYDEDKYGPRMKHSLWHEIGHVKCNHKKHGDSEEIEAHHFASQANAPNVLIKALSQRGYAINTSSLMECFGLSKEAAEKKMDYLSTYGFNHSNQYDDVVLQQFSEYLNKKYPFKTNNFYDSYFDEMETRRNEWF